MSNLQLRLFGAPEIVRDGSVLTFDTRKAVALLAYLAATGSVHRRESLAALLWPDSDQSRARASLRRTLSVASTAGPALVITRSEIGLDPARTCSDLTDFEHLARREDPDSLRRAADLGAEPFLAGFSLRDSADFDDWTAATADRLRWQLTSVLARLAAMEATAGNLEEATVVARRWVGLDPLSEAAHRELMRLLAWTGQRPAALKQYRNCVRALDRELGVAPLAETTELYDDIRANRLKPAHVPMISPAAVAPDVNRGPAQPTAATPIGRAKELKILAKMWRAAHEVPGAAVIVGAPGIGRTTLAASMRADVSTAGGVSVLIRGHAAESTLAYAAIVDLARHLVSRDEKLTEPLASVGSGVETPGERLRVFELMREAVGQALSKEVPGLLVVDDAQWLDPTSADLIGYLLRRPPPGVLVLATRRTDDFSLEDTHASPQVIHLQPWSPADVETALKSLDCSPSDYQEVHRRTNGNPRLIMEFLAAAGVADSSPASGLLDIVGARLDAAPTTTRQVLGATAVLGTVSEPELIRQVSGRDEFELVEALEDAVGRGLLVEDTERLGYDFPYDTLRNLVMERISLARLRLLHGRAADALARGDAAPDQTPPATRVANHLSLAGREPEAALWFWRAAQQACSLYAHREALDNLRSALAMGYDAAACHLASGDALTKLALYSEALVAYEQAAAIAGDDRHSLAVIEHKLAEVHERLGDWAIAQAHLESAGDLLADDGPTPMLAQVLADLALVMQRQADPEAELVGHRAAELAEQSGDSVSMAQAQNVLGVIAAGQGNIDRAGQLLESSRTQALASEDVTLLVAALNNLARLHAQEGQLEQALAAAHEALELGVRQGDQHRIAALHDHLADLLHSAGRPGEAMDHQKSAAALFGGVDNARVRPEVWKLVSW